MIYFLLPTLFSLLIPTPKPKCQKWKTEKLKKMTSPLGRRAKPSVCVRWTKKYLKYFWQYAQKCLTLPHITIKPTLMTHAGHKAYKKVDQLSHRACHSVWQNWFLMFMKKQRLMKAILGRAWDGICRGYGGSFSRNRPNGYTRYGFYQRIGYGTETYNTRIYYRTAA